ncbi:GNAT family N-acetyltransferase [Candidatus Pelagibacter sp.]|jgi:GNAT superfamily N-acetyltransferase|nr:GNAT family N-acetyltransferase [Candidatus Pelagibacter sp.]
MRIVDTMNISYKNSNTNKNLNQYIKLYNSCFGQNKYKSEYLDWLYNKNPDGKYLGIDCFDDENLIGQVGGIPREFICNKKKVNFLISIMVCVDPKYQGQGIFSKMLTMFEQIANELNFDGIIAIANNAALASWQRSVKMKNLGPLDVFIGYGKLNADKINKSKYNFYTSWSKRNLEWRIKNPANKTLFQSDNKNKSIFSNTNFVFIDAYSPIIFFEDDIKELKTIKRNIYKPIIYVGLINEFKKTPLLFNLPAFLKPSPLYFLYKFLKTDQILEPKELFFTFLEFDAF